MRDILFHVEGITAVEADGAPALRARLRVVNASPARPVHSIALRWQVHIDPARRSYSRAEGSALWDLFGAPERWANTVRPIAWASGHATVAAFSTSVLSEVTIPCGSEAALGARRYLAALAQGEVPLRFLFSGTIYYAASDNVLQVAPIPWDSEAAFNLPESARREVVRGASGDRDVAVLNRAISEVLERCRQQVLAATGRAARNE
jgi:hypothetical protein